MQAHAPALIRCQRSSYAGRAVLLTQNRFHELLKKTAAKT